MVGETPTSVVAAYETRIFMIVKMGWDKNIIFYPHHPAGQTFMRELVQTIKIYCEGRNLAM